MVLEEKNALSTPAMGSAGSPGIPTKPVRCFSRGLRVSVQERFRQADVVQKTGLTLRESWKDGIESGKKTFSM
jgi:hypothetical protein